MAEQIPERDAPPAKARGANAASGSGPDQESPDAASLQPYAQMERLLRERWLALSAEIRATLQRADSEKYADVAGQVTDFEDAALADLIVDINNAEVTRDVEELRAIQAALQRIAAGTYGVCVRCGAEIPWARLEAYPTAERCVPCQEYCERNRVQPPTSTL
jgi:phage/conjugal plasmid C-4 type zinc finger TraR family protein